MFSRSVLLAALLGVAHAGHVQYQCATTHASFNDPIVFPSDEGAAHKHIFWGNTDVDHNTISANGVTNRITTDDLAGSSCVGGGDTSRGDTIINKSSYWVAPIIDSNDNTVLPTDITIRYSKTTNADVVGFPAGLTLIAGDGSATETYDTDYAYFRCGGTGTRFGSIPQDCTEDIEMRIHFQDCWTGQTVNWFLANPDKGSHVAYSTNGVCPSSHPVAIPEIRYDLTFPNTNSAGLYLASDRYDSRCDTDGGYTVHADFMNGWDEGVMAEFAQLINDEPENTNVVGMTSEGALRQGRARSPLDIDGSLSNNEVRPKCGCRNNADLSLCSIPLQEEVCACDQDGIVDGIDTGRPACTYESNNFGLICHVSPLCDSASNSGTFPGTKWRQCDPAVDGAGPDVDDGDDGDDSGGGGGDDSGDSGDSDDSDDGDDNDNTPAPGDDADGDEEEGLGVAGIFKKNAKTIGISCAGAAAFGLIVFSYFRIKGTFSVVNGSHRKGKNYKGNKMGSVKGKWPPSSEMV